MTPQEAIIHALVVQSRAISTEVIAMQAHDKFAEGVGKGSYTETSYLALATQLYAIGNEIQEIARSGALL